MKRSFATAVVCLCLALGSAALALAPSALAAKDHLLQPRAAVTSTCHYSVQHAAHRSIVAYATMRPVTGTKKLAIMFLLQAKPTTGLAPFTTQNSKGLGTWFSPTDPSTLGQHPHDVWHVNQPVDGLALGYSYRFKVKFRWYGAHAKVLRNTTLFSVSCVEPQPLTKTK